MQENTWFPLDVKTNPWCATHALVTSGQVIFRLRPYYAFAYDSDPFYGQAKPLEGTEHKITPLVLQGELSTVASEGWRTIDGRSNPGCSLEEATQKLADEAKRIQSIRGDKQELIHSLSSYVVRKEDESHFAVLDFLQNENFNSQESNVQARDTRERNRLKI